MSINATTRRGTGFFFIIIGIAIILYSIANYKVLWSGIRAQKVEVVKEVVKEVPVKDSADTIHIGPILIEHAWHFIEGNCEKEKSCNPSGEYQFKDLTSNSITIAKFCEPIPLLTQGDIIELYFMDPKPGATCSQFLRAKILQEK